MSHMTQKKKVAVILYADFCVVLFSGGAIQAERDQSKETQKQTNDLFEPEH